MKNRILVLLAAVVAIIAVCDEGYSGDLGWNRFTSAGFNLMFEYPAFLRAIREDCGPVALQVGDARAALSNAWVFKNQKWTIALSLPDDRESQSIISLSVFDNPDGVSLLNWALALAINECGLMGQEAARIDIDSLEVASSEAVHARTWVPSGSGEYKHFNLYVFQANERIFAMNIGEECMKAALTPAYGDYDAVVDRIVRSLSWLER